jgi:small subunit ribosomal protein S24e
VLKAKEDCISIFGMKPKFGGGRTTAFALVYDSFDEKKKYDSKTNLKRVSTTICTVVAKTSLLMHKEKRREIFCLVLPCCRVGVSQVLAK